MSERAPKQPWEITTLENDADFCDFLDRQPSGLVMVAETISEVDQPILKPDTGDFAKWLKANHPQIDVEIQKGDRLVLHSHALWLPLVFLAKDVALPLYLNLVASYLYDKTKGALRSDRSRVNMSAEYRDPATGLVKRFKFEGDAEALRDTIEQLSRDDFFHG